MKKTFTIIILTYFLFTLNINRAFTQEAASQGCLHVGHAQLSAVQLAPPVPLEILELPLARATLKTHLPVVTSTAS